MAEGAGCHDKQIEENSQKDQFKLISPKKSVGGIDKRIVLKGKRASNNEKGKKLDLPAQKEDDHPCPEQSNMLSASEVDNVDFSVYDADNVFNYSQPS